MKKKILAIVAVVVVIAVAGYNVCTSMFYSCSDIKKDTSLYKDVTSICYEDFSNHQQLNSTVFLSEDEVMKPIRLYVCDTLLITMNSGERKLFHLFSLNTKKKIGERVSIRTGAWRDDSSYNCEV